MTRSINSVSHPRGIRPGKRGGCSGAARLLPAFIGAMLLLLLLPACKPTEKNYRAAYDVAREKRERENRLREEIRSDMGVGGGVMQEVDGAALADIGGQSVWTRHLNFQRADSVAEYSVSVAAFSMLANARAMAGDLRQSGWEDAREASASERHYVLVGQSADPAEALAILNRFHDSHPEWQYVGQPGIMLVIGGSR